MMNFKNYVRCVCFFGRALVRGADSVDVVFVGNSYTSANGMVDVFNGMVESVRGGGVDVGM
jgi:hypothetical protein